MQDRHHRRIKAWRRWLREAYNGMVRYAAATLTAILVVLAGATFGWVSEKPPISHQISACHSSEGKSIRNDVRAAGLSPTTLTCLPSAPVKVTGESEAFSTLRQQDDSCKARFIWPVQTAWTTSPKISKAFDNPAQPWLPGHRGIDIIPPLDNTLIVPADGRISFVGRVAGKHVVSIRHDGGLSTTYEPAQTKLTVGTMVSKAQAFGTIEGQSDHCSDGCLHWGVKIGKRTYLDPEHQVRPQRITLKPL